ncbi:DNA helicase RecQ [Sandaracinobacteroides saxicola]|uniref:DNA helicase RecQ n=1 Tax=Sandaracinobacteroides saxicola TaxID=2759707 RepID=A0A7G5IF40_9SPHN|nr:DNA helicase RecQ [Sandaracinobacteroides saxicola]QMW21982.1 DNA helicase RecQ [Sandaracinobacteroides saxicola]
MFPPPPPAARDCLTRIFGFADFRPSQGAIVGALCAGQDVAAIMPTGAGKSLCYQIPALVRPGTALVISPLIALMQDQVRALTGFGVRAASLTSADPADAQARTRAALERGALDLLYVSPERLATPAFQSLLATTRIALVAVDEAHCVSEWGHDFRPEYRLIRGVLDSLPNVPRIALTATADANTRADICANLGIDPANMLVAGFDRPNITYRVEPRRNPRAQITALLQKHPQASAIIYCRSRAQVDQIADALAAAGFPALPYHAGLDAPTRSANQARWAAEPGQIMVATVAFGMGVDKPDVRLVIHLGLPKSIEGYYQETGRAGRDGDPATAVTLHGSSDISRNRQWLDEIEDPARRAIEAERLAALLRFVEATGCRRVPLLAHFGDSPAPSCRACDNCLSPPRLSDLTEPARKLLSAVYRTGQRFGIAHLTDVLRGQATPRVNDLGHDRLPLFGIGADLPKTAWAALARTLEAEEALLRDADHHGLRLGPAARAILKGERSVRVADSALAPRAKRERRRDRGTPADSSDPRFERLRALRRELAVAAGVPPYVIFHDSVLHAIVAANPRNLADLATIPGVGEAKRERYGAAFLAALGR